MIESRLVGRLTVLLVILHPIYRVDGISHVGAKSIETISKTMRVESRLNLTRYRLVKDTIKRHLMNVQNDVSPVELMIHPKANPRVIDAVAKACSERKPTLMWTHKNRPTHRSCNRSETCSRVNHIIVIYSNIDDINPSELKNAYGNAWNSRSKIVILVTETTSEREDSIDRARLEQTLENFWSIDCLNVALMTMPRFEDNCTVVAEPRIFGFDPFGLEIGKTDIRGQLLERTSRSPFFPDKLRDLQGYSIPISLYHQEPHAVLINYTELGSGVYVSIVRYLSASLNFTVDLKSAPIEASSYKISLPDGNEVGPIGDVVKNRSDFLANPIFLSGASRKRIEFIRPGSRTHVAVLVPRGKPMPGIIRVFRSMDMSLAIVMFACLTLLACYFCARKKRYPFLKIYRLFVHQQLRGISEKSSDRIFSIAWIIWAFILSTALQSQLKKDMTDPPFYKSIDTLKELASSRLTLMANPDYLDNLNRSDSETKKLLAKSAVRDLDLSRCTQRFVKRRDVACALESFYITHVSRQLNAKHRDEQWRRGISHVAKEYLTDDWRVFVVKEGFPYLEKFNAAFEQMREMGLAKKWILDDVTEHFEEGPSRDAHIKLNMLHFEGTFYILLIGEGIALVVFIVEIIFHWAKRRFGRSQNRRRTTENVLDKRRITKFV